MRIAVAEDQLFFRAGLVALLEAADIEVIYEASSGGQLLTFLARGTRPDVAILDIRMAGHDNDGLVAALEMERTCPEVGVLLLSQYSELTYAEQLFANGSAGKGYALKDNLNNIADLQEALRRIHRRQTYCDPRIVDLLISRRQRLDRLLTPREQRVLALLARGLSNKAIASDLNLSEGRTESIIGDVYGKMDIHDAPEYNRRVLAALRWLDED